MAKIASQKIIERGKEIYYRLKPSLKKKYKPSYYVGIEVESGDYFVGKNTLEALKKAKKQYPQKQFFLAQIGRIAGVLK